MELVWHLKGYALSVKVSGRREAMSRFGPGEERMVEPSRALGRSEKAREDLLHAAGSRYAGLTR